MTPALTGSGENKVKDQVTRPQVHRPQFEKKKKKKKEFKKKKKKERERAEADSNRGPSAYQPNALPPGQTASQESLRCTLKEKEKRDPLFKVREPGAATLLP